MTNDKVREAFEEMMRKDHANFPLEYVNSSDDIGDLSYYEHHGTQHMWNGYRAAQQPAQAGLADEQILELAKERFGWAYGLGGFEDAIKDFARALSRAHTAPARIIVCPKFGHSCNCDDPCKAAQNPSPCQHEVIVEDECALCFEKVPQTDVRTAVIEEVLSALHSRLPYPTEACAIVRAIQPTAAPVSEQEKLDAERYRWLRNRVNSLETRQRDKGIVSGPSCYHEVEGIREPKWGEELDTAVDAAKNAAVMESDIGDEAFAGIVKRYEDAGDQESADIIRKQWDAAKSRRAIDAAIAGKGIS